MCSSGTGVGRVRRDGKRISADIGAIAAALYLLRFICIPAEQHGIFRLLHFPFFSSYPPPKGGESCSRSGFTDHGKTFLGTDTKITFDQSRDAGREFMTRRIFGKLAMTSYLAEKILTALYHTTDRYNSMYGVCRI